MALLWCGRTKIGPNHENSVRRGPWHYFQYLTKRKCELRYNIKWKSWIQFIWHLTWQCLQKWQFWIFILHCLMKRDGVDRMFPFIKWDISEWDSGYKPKIISWGLIKLVGNSHVYQAPRSNCFIAARAIGAHKVLFNV